MKSLIDLHGGSVTATSKGEGQGCEFTMTLPLIDNPADHFVVQTIETANTEQPLRLLIVDDNVDAANVLAMFLEAIGHTVSIEHDPVKALERARREVPDICLLDIGLPGMDGNELAMRLKSQTETKNCKLIAITGYSQESDRKSTAAAGFDHHLVKPIDLQELTGLLQAHEHGN